MGQILLQDDRCCFVCGIDNPDGLRIEWKIEEFSTTAEFIPDQKYQGWKGMLHGGIIATLLDEAMTRLASIVYGGAVTAEMTVRYVSPAPIGETLLVKGEIMEESRKLVKMRASLRDISGKIVAHATGKVIKLKTANGSIKRTLADI
jgi:uncharacterized protein (TIGR00369 family)